MQVKVHKTEMPERRPGAGSMAWDWVRRHWLELLLPPAIFAAIHEKFRTPHLSTMLTGGIIAVVAAVTPIRKLEEMVNIGTLMAFVIVCAAVWLLRRRRPTAPRPFRAPLLFLVAPLGIFVNTIMMLFLPVDTWILVGANW